MAKKLFREIYLNVDNNTAFFYMGDSRYVNLKNPVTPASIERISSLSFTSGFTTRYLAPSNASGHHTVVLEVKFP